MEVSLRSNIGGLDRRNMSPTSLLHEQLDNGADVAGLVQLVLESLYENPSSKRR